MTDDANWDRYGSTMIESMAEVLADAPEESRALLLETADYWLALGLTIGVNRPADGTRLLHLIEADEQARRELGDDAASFVDDVLA